MGKDGKTEKATPQKRREARREGQVARSQDVAVALSLGGLALGLRVATPAGLDVLRRETTALLGSGFTDPAALGSLTWPAVRIGLALGGPLIVIGVVTSVVAGVGQTGFSPAPKAAKPRLSHLSPKRGLSRLKPATAGWELVRSAAKLGLLFAAVWGPLRSWTLDAAPPRNLDAGLSLTLDHVWVLLMRGLLIAGVVAAADYVWNARKLARDLRMSKEEVKQEYRNSEGDPLIKAQRKRRASELSRNRMLAEVAFADVVVTNPTHLAVALRFDPAEAAPRVVAKGADHVAAKIRKEAYRHGVLVRTDVPLARALYRQCKVGAYVPGPLFEAVALVLALAYRLRGRTAA